MFMSKKEIIGIDIGSSSVKLVQLKEQRGTYVLKNVGMLPLPAEAIVDNALMDTSSIVETIRSLAKSLGVKVKDGACSISGNAVIIRKISLPEMSSEELEDQIQWEAEQYIPFDINDVFLDFQILGPDHMDTSKMQVLLVASKKDIINDYVAVFREAGLRLVVVDVDSFAVQNAFEQNYSPGEDEMVALINIGASIMNLNIVRGGLSLFTRDVQMGGNAYTEELQKQVGISGEEAERLKISGEYAAQTKLRDVVARVNDTLAQEMRRSLDFYISSAGDERVSKVYLSGGCAKIGQLVETVNQKLGVPVEVLDPFRKLKVNEKTFDTEYLEQIGPLMTVAVGLATRRVGDK